MNNNQEAYDSYAAWQQKEHQETFSLWDKLSTKKLIRRCYDFNEFQLYKNILGNNECQTISDIGCATGGFYRFFKATWPEINYTGFDISNNALAKARARYPNGTFKKYQGDISSDIIFSRDVVHHQIEPCTFLETLYDAAQQYLIIRVRTREEGSTVFDPNISCQYTYNHWVPYIVFNTEELISLIGSFNPAPTNISIRRNPIVLGGTVGRYLPKELYYSETGTSETAILIEKNGTESSREPTIIRNEISVEHINPYPPLYKLAKLIAKRIL